LGDPLGVFSVLRLISLLTMRRIQLYALTSEIDYDRGEKYIILE
jgi:hypothetical protein